MSIEFYDASVACYQQTLAAVDMFLHKSLMHCQENNLDPETALENRIHPDMRPLRYQLQASVHHSVNAMIAFEHGHFAPPANLPDSNYRALQDLVKSALTTLDAYSRAGVNALAENRVIFTLGDKQLPFTADNFLLSFSLPNFYFHVTTAYDIFRALGVPVGKRDYLGALKFTR